MRRPWLDIEVARRRFPGRHQDYLNALDPRGNFSMELFWQWDSEGDYEDTSQARRYSFYTVPLTFWRGNRLSDLERELHQRGMALATYWVENRRVGTQIRNQLPAVLPRGPQDAHADNQLRRNYDRSYADDAEFVDSAMIMVWPVALANGVYQAAVGEHAATGAQFDAEDRVFVGATSAAAVLPFFRRPSRPLQAGEAGRFGDLDARGIVGDDLTPHHMPQAARGFTPYADGGALVLPRAEHMLTRTYAGRGGNCSGTRG